jgi:A/G-specific adenine glycosylase
VGVDIPALNEWFALNQRPLPWRDPSCSPWGVMVSEVMLQQTPVARVEPVWHDWITRWPTPSDLARSSQADAVGAWGRLGYPRRAMRLYQAARILHSEHGGAVPRELAALLALPGIGDYTARAIRTFAFGIPEPVVDINVRRVMARAHVGEGDAGPARISADRETVWEVLKPLDAQAQVSGAKALMELGAVTCTARSPQCAVCPIRESCAWRAAGYPPYRGKKAPTQARFEGSDRQVRGIILRELRGNDTPVPEEFLTTLWHDATQFHRALESLLADGLAARTEGGIALAS